ncbi:helix-turn-helix transcriptional regulator [Nocardioides sp. URHA0032]|uniref:helix-turn-helix transcriptional regulator n=1 Tax=Nocardioides sp. URHA0032 TaxID=1380388 RepID=UPI0009DCA5D2|nr:LuxR family transcriptional regulator [Nocardioides sp. URHA0032]
MGDREHRSPLTGRDSEKAFLDQLVADVRSGASRSLVVHGEAGVGKTALLEYVAARGADGRLVRASGVQSEMELPFAALHQLCGSMLGNLDRLSGPQRDALATAFGLAAGPPPDRFLVGLATLGVLAEEAAQGPLLCLVDDHQWLDQESRQVLAFVARRLGAESIGLVFAARVLDDELSGLPQLPVDGLEEPDARALLDSVLTGSLDERVRNQIVTETRGNPLALLELPRGRTADDLAGGFAIPHGSGIARTVENDFRRRIRALPDDTRRLLVLASADPTGDSGLVWRGARHLGIRGDAASAAADHGLAEFDSRVRFRHPLARSVSYWSAPAAERQTAHRALAEETDRAADPDRYSWHLAHATPGPDEEVADELERSAARAGARGGLAAAAAFLQRSVALTIDPRKRAQRALTAAVAQFQAGAFAATTELLDLAEAGPLEEPEKAQISLIRAQLAFVLHRGGEAPALLLAAAVELEAIDPGSARVVYLGALNAATFAGRAATARGTVREVARTAGVAARSGDPTEPTDWLLLALTANFNEGYAEGVPHFRQALASFGSDTMTPDQELRLLWPISSAALHLWEDDQWLTLSRRYVDLAHATGALSELPLALSTRAMVLLFAGDLTTAAALVEEQETVTSATGSQLAPYSAMCLAAMRGQDETAERLVELTGRDAVAKGEGISIAVGEWTRAVLYNGQGRYAEAAAAAREALYHQEYPELRYPGIANWAAAELIEAACRCGDDAQAAEAVEWLTEMTSASGTPWALGVQARSRALVSSGKAADAAFLEAISWLEHTQVRAELARTHLVYGEWLRRGRRRTEAREHLRTAHEALDAMGMESFAARARRELLATGETARRRSAPATQELTPQEVLIAQLAREGLSNPEIGSRLFISARTVQYHLRKVFAKVGITSRSQLDRVELTS